MLATFQCHKRAQGLHSLASSMIHDINGWLLFGAEIDSRTACFGS